MKDEAGSREALIPPPPARPEYRGAIVGLAWGWSVWFCFIYSHSRSLVAEVKCLMKYCLLVDKWHADRRPVYSAVEYGFICWLWKSVSLKMADRNVYENVLHFQKSTKAHSGKEKDSVLLYVNVKSIIPYKHVPANHSKAKHYIVFRWLLPSFLCLSLPLITIIFTFLSLLPKTVTQVSLKIEIAFKLRCISLVNSITYSIEIHSDIPSSSFFFLSPDFFFFLIHIWRQCASKWPYYK